jgi:tripeptide aminopeptidase
MTSTLTFAPAKTIQQVLLSPLVQRAFQFFESNADEITGDHIAICSLPAPPFGEAERAQYLSRKLRDIGLTETSIDAEGNCIALRQGMSLSPLLVVSAHLDTVFTAGTDFTVRQIQNKLLGPGVSDDGCGLAALIALAKTLEANQIKTEGSVLFVGTVGEEGEGDLRGVRYLLNRGEWSNCIHAFLSFDGPGLDRITNRALGSRRYRVRLKGRGGHSWGDFGTVNPVHAIGRAVARLVAYPAPTDPRTTFNVGRIEGGSSINAIPSDAAMDVDLRSACATELRRLDAFFRRAVQEASDDENALRRKGDAALELEVRLIGDRPTGETPADSPIVETAVEATRALGCIPRLDQASTDSNMPISMGIPAITLGVGGTSGNSHTLNEWYDQRGRDLGLKRALLVMLGMVGMKAEG